MKRIEVEHIDMTLGLTIEYRGSMLRLPILVLQCTNGGHLEREDGELAFSGGNS